MTDQTPVYSIGVAAQILNVHPRTLRIYEDEGLIKPARKGNRRYFSQNDVVWIDCLRKMIHDEGISIPGIKKLLRYAPCWEITDCPKEVCEPCTAKVDQVVPSKLRVAGDKVAEQKAWEQEAAERKQALADQPETQPASKQKL
ncbi:MAG: MerR family transcriptional regulator [Desulfobulbaceae bacterium]|nr:MAG: MerR family transcriptional regulator [Desulfobulbaceae bacterium]